jgi:hypothetical protein
MLFERGERLRKKHIIIISVIIIILIVSSAYLVLSNKRLTPSEKMIIAASDLPTGNWTYAQQVGEHAYLSNCSDDIVRTYYNNPYTEKIEITLIHFNSSEAAREMRDRWIINSDRTSSTGVLYGTTTYYWNATTKHIDIGDGGSLIQVHNFPIQGSYPFPGQFNDTMLCFVKSNFYVTVYILWSDHNLINETEVLRIAQNQADNLSG